MTKYTEKDMNALLDRLSQLIDHRTRAMSLIKELIVEIPESEKKYWLSGRIESLCEEINPSIKAP